MTKTATLRDAPLMYHFAPTDDEGNAVLNHRDNRTITEGKTLTARRAALCNCGLHASPTIAYALNYTAALGLPAPALEIVRLYGQVDYDQDKSAATKRRCEKLYTHKQTQAALEQFNRAAIAIIAAAHALPLEVTLYATGTATPAAAYDALSQLIDRIPDSVASIAQEREEINTYLRTLPARRGEDDADQARTRAFAIARDAELSRTQNRLEEQNGVAIHMRRIFGQNLDTIGNAASLARALPRYTSRTQDILIDCFAAHA